MAVNRRSQFTHLNWRFDPWWDKVRSAPEFTALRWPIRRRSRRRSARTPYLGAPKAGAVSCERRGGRTGGPHSMRPPAGGYTRETLAIVEGQARQATISRPLGAGVGGQRAGEAATSTDLDGSPARRQATQTMARARWRSTGRGRTR